MNNKGADQPAHPRSLISTIVIRYLESTIVQLAPGFFWAHFDDQYWVMFPMAKSMFFPILWRNFPNQETKKKSPFCHKFVTSYCTVSQQIFKFEIF